MIKYTESVIKKECNNKNLIFISIVDIKTNNRKRRMVEFLCPKHLKYESQYLECYKIMTNKQPCQYCNHHFLRHTFKDEVESINPNITVLSKYVNWNSVISCRCKIDGHEWEAHPSTLLSGGGCPICGIKKASRARIQNSADSFQDKLFTVNPNIEIIGEFEKSHSPILCKCKIDGNVWKSSPSNLLNGNSKCHVCTLKRLSESQKLSKEQIESVIKNNNLPIKLISKYKNNKTKIEVECLKCHRKYLTLPKNFLYFGKTGCPYCTQTKGEEKMFRILNKFGIQITPQYSFSDCKHINKLRFDGYDERNSVAYEYQGEQHYIPIDFAGRGEEWAKEQLKLNKQRDEIKRDFCKINDIRLIEIPYWEFDNMEDFIKKELKI